MARFKVISIDSDDHFADYAELGVLHDQERFARTQPKPFSIWNLLNPVLTLFVGGMIWYGFIWIAIGGWRIVHHILGIR